MKLEVWLNLALKRWLLGMLMITFRFSVINLVILRKRCFLRKSLTFKIIGYGNINYTGGR